MQRVYNPKQSNQLASSVIGENASAEGTLGAPLEVAQRQASQARAVQVVEYAEDDRLCIPVLELGRLLRDKRTSL